MRARVKQHHNYGGNAPAGTIVEVEQAELERVPWCLEAVEEAVEVAEDPVEVVEPIGESVEEPEQPKAKRKR